MKTIVITGASGYIGRCLVTKLLALGDYRVKVLTRHSQEISSSACLFPNSVEVVIGDLQAPELLTGLFERDCTVINLVYMWGAGIADNVAVTTNLLRLCSAAGVGRIIHCSTAAVVGRVEENDVTEDTVSNPITEYGKTKLAVEEVIRGAQNFCDVAILRPTAVFGIDGAPLKKLASDLAAGKRVTNYLKSCLFGRRRMNLVHVDNVVASLLFFIDYQDKFGAEIFIVSDDDDPSNNFADVEHFLMNRLAIPPYKFPRFLIPLGVLSFILNRLGRNNVNPRCNYSPNKISALGFRRPKSFMSGLEEYAEWWRSTGLRQ
ncbi:Conserved hypothetical proteinn putative NAD-dependent epimerase/dehydratase [Herminiimonas arsenicoxydans]|uniref:NAD-dependent epimerase/dehydratase domain-containing protein n=1 Tax=Herminiimonas arsenicoxydans TaxID=204773 RepID=A4G485_HERAR|nr:Conserved hypothetical proteinn putative NAD-dependent epimerase/dehydratase [Herminiimonas arsenicoxydans]